MPIQANTRFDVTFKKISNLDQNKMNSIYRNIDNKLQIVLSFRLFFMFFGRYASVSGTTYLRDKHTIIENFMLLEI